DYADEGSGIFNSGNTGADFQLDIFDGEWRYAGDTAGNRILGSVTTDWTHIGITCDGTNTRMYLNGVLKHTIAKKDNVFQHYRLGANRAVSAHFKGLIDEVRIYNDALDSSIETLADVSLKNFPVLVRLRDGLNGFSYNQVKSLKGGDLRFLNTAGVELPYSIDVWNPDGESDIWVSVDQLRLQGGTKFTMYWGNPEATAVPPYATNGSAWSDFHLVTNLGETTHINDISPNGYLGTGTSNVNQPTVGLIGGARTFTADNNSILFPGRPADADSISSSAWFYFTKVPGQDETFWYTRQWGVGDMRVYFHTDGKLRYEVHSGNPSAQYTAANPIVEDDLNKWTHLATVYDLVTKRYTFYKNGEINHTSTIGSPRNARISTGVVLGAHEWGNWREMRSANIDQFELHDAARSQAWFKASIESERAGSDFLTASNFDGPPEFVGEVQITGLINNDASGNPVSEAISTQIPIKGTAESITAVGLPAGLSLQTGGVISGTPLTGGTTPVTVTATGKGVTVEKKVTVKVVDITNYTHSLTLSFSGYTGSDTLENFPVLVELGTHISNFSYNSFLSPEGGDLRFFDGTSGSASVGRELP
ncbi:MAG: DUF2341 domain-containing protein, partial [Opitutae bacterium]